MEYLIFIWAIFALICMYMADKRGRSQLLGAVSGAIFGLLAVIYYALAGDTVEKRVQREAEAKAKLGL